MKPDYIEGEISHFKDETIEIFYKQFEEVKEINPDRNPYRFSVKLGELFHYIADYFSRAHNDPELAPGTLKEKFIHIFHEWKLNRYAANLHPDFFKGLIEDNFVYRNSLADFIEKEHANFLAENYSFENDIAATFKVCILLTNKLLYEIQLENNYAFAHVFNLRHRLLYQKA